MEGTAACDAILNEDQKRAFLTEEELKECQLLKGEDFDLCGAWATPYAHQVECVVAARKYREGFAELPCGAGKSAVVFMIANDRGSHEHPPKRVLVVGGGRSASVQLLEEARKNTTLGETLTFAFATENKARRAQPVGAREVMVTSYHHLSAACKGDGAFHSARKYTRQPWDLIILDECHQAMADGAWANIQLLRSPETTVIGLTGTPFRTPTPDELKKALSGDTLLEQSSRFLDKLGPRFYGVTAKELEAQKLIAKVKYNFITVPQGRDMSESYSSLSKTERRDVLAALNLNKALAICSIVKHHVELGETGICFVQKLACADALELLIESLPFLRGTQIVKGASGKDKSDEHDRRLKGVLGQLERKEIPLAILTKSSEEGLNVKSLSYVLMSDGPGASVRSDTQRAGRACRNITPGVQKSATVYSLSMQETHEEREKEAYVQSVLKNGFVEGEDIFRSTFDVSGASAQTGADDELLLRVAKELIGRQESCAGARHAAEVKRKNAKKTSEMKMLHKNLKAGARPIMKSRIAAMCDRTLQDHKRKAAELFASADEEGRKAYRASKQ